MIPTVDLPWRTCRLKKGIQQRILSSWTQCRPVAQWSQFHKWREAYFICTSVKVKWSSCLPEAAARISLRTSSACSCLSVRVQVTASCWMSWWECSSWEGIGPPISSTEENIELRAYWQRYSKIWYLSSIRKITACPGSFWNLLWTVSCNL